MSFRIMEGPLCHERGLETFDVATDALEACVLKTDPAEWPITLQIEDEQSGEVVHIGEWDLTEDVLKSSIHDEY